MSTGLAIGFVVCAFLLYMVVKGLLIKFDARTQFTYGYSAFGFFQLLMCAVFVAGILTSGNNMLLGIPIALVGLGLLVVMNFKGLTKHVQPLNVKAFIGVTLMQLLQVSVIVVALLAEFARILMNVMQAMAFGGSSRKTQTGRRITRTEAVRLEFERLQRGMDSDNPDENLQ